MDKAIVVDDSFLKDESPFDGPQISWFTPGGIGHTGYGVAAIALIQALQHKRVKVSFATDIPYVHVSYIQPEYYRHNPKQYVIGYTCWESSEIPDTWAYHMNKCDEIWAPSQFCVDVYKAGGVTVPVRLLPHGIDPDLWTIKDREIGEKFKFLHVGGESERKGVQKVVDAFLDLFDGRDDIELVLKSHDFSPARWSREGDWMGNVSSHPQITCITETFESPFDLAAMYHDAHCFVYPSSGEGFGFLPFQAMATGMPTICTDLTSMKDFAHMAMPLKATWGPGNGIHLGDWAVPDLDHLRELMADAVENWAENKKRAMQSARIIHSKMTWDSYATQAIDMIGDKINQTAI